MELIADGLLFAGALAAALYCWVLSRRISALKDLDSGLGGAISKLSQQVDDIRASLQEARSTTDTAVEELSEKILRADEEAGRLERLLAALQAESERADDLAPRRAAPVEQDAGNVIRVDTARDEAPAPAQPDDTGAAPAGEAPAEPQREEVLSALRNIVQGMR